MADITIKQGDRLPKIARRFVADGSAVDLTSASVVFNLWNASSGAQVITGAACSITDVNGGIAEYAWSAQDAALPVGVYLGSFTATYASGNRKLTAPGDGMITVEILGITSSDWSYTNNPGARTIDNVRFLVGDTDPDVALLKDGEITFLLDQWNNDPYLAAAAACDALSAKFAAKSDVQKSVGDLSLSTSYGEQANRWREQAAAIRVRAAAATSVKPIIYKDGQGRTGGLTHFTLDMDRNLRA